MSVAFLKAYKVLKDAVKELDDKHEDQENALLYMLSMYKRLVEAVKLDSRVLSYPNRESARQLYSVLASCSFCRLI